MSRLPMGICIILLLKNIVLSKYIPQHIEQYDMIDIDSYILRCDFFIPSFNYLILVLICIYRYIYNWLHWYKQLYGFWPFLLHGKGTLMHSKNWKTELHHRHFQLGLGQLFPIYIYIITLPYVFHLSQISSCKK